MNYLAHLYLADRVSGGEPLALVGNLMGDFVKGPVADHWPPSIRDGIILHRQIDSFTDRHPVVTTSKTRLDDGFRRYGGILIDVFYDHFLSRCWPDYCAEPLDQFSRRVYRILTDCYSDLPPRMQTSVDYMIGRDLLVSYRQRDGIARSLLGLSTRLSRTNRLADGIGQLDRHYEDLATDFELFFPQLIDYTTEQYRH